MVGTLISRRWNNNGHVSPKDGGPAGKPVAPWPLIFIKFFQMKMPSHIHALMLVFAGFVAFGCSQGTTMTIEGSIDRRYDGQTIFLVPQPYPTLETVDSTKVRKGRFRFTADASTVRMCDVTISNKARAPFVQRLLVAVEPGTLNVRLDTVSRPAEHLSTLSCSPGRRHFKGERMSSLPPWTSYGITPIRLGAICITCTTGRCLNHRKESWTRWA